MLENQCANRLKVGGLFLVYAAAWFCLDMLGVRSLSSPWQFATLAPILAVYLAERSHKLLLFEGMTFPSLLLMTASNALVWVLNAPPKTPALFAYATFALWIGAAAFLFIRLWTFRSSRSANRGPTRP